MHAATRPAGSRHLLVIMLAIFGLAAGLAAIKPEPYASSELVFLAAGSRYIQDQALSATSGPVLNYALHQLGLNEPASSLRPKVKSTVEASRLVRITVQSTNPADADRKVRAVTLAYVHVLNEGNLASCRKASGPGIHKSPCVRKGRDACPLGGPALLPHVPLVAVGTVSGGLGIAGGLFVAALIVLFGARERPRPAF